MIVPVVLSGGSGSRLWPVSRELYPKQLLPLVNEATMLQNTLTRLDGADDIASPMVICNDHHRFMVAEQLRVIKKNPSAIVLEPVGRNTAPAAAIAAMQATLEGYDPVLLILPADHVIMNMEALQAVVNVGKSLAVEGNIITFGIVPDAPETGYGYIRSGRQLGQRGGIVPCAIDSFVEKPDLETAQKYLDSGEYFWNSGMFMFLASRYIEELERYAPDIVSACRTALEKGQKDLDFIRLDEEAFSGCPSDSIDYAVMENTADGVVVPLDAGWNDVGSWSALWGIGKKDEADNVVLGDVLARDSKGCYFHSEDRLIASVGLEDIVVVETRDATLVARKDKVQDVKEVVNELKSRRREEAFNHKAVFRPWGHYESVAMGERYQVKRITVKPGAILSKQLHYHRAEHWVVVKGTARITKGDEVFTMTENQSTFIPLGVVHRLENPGKVDLELIEVQSGSYLAEDDIVRFDDKYGRRGAGQ